MSSLFLPVSPLPAFSLMGRTLYWQHLVPFTVLSLYSDVCSVLSPSQCRIPWRIRAHFCLLHSLCKNPTCTKSSSQVRDSALKQFLFPGGHTVLEVPQTHIKQGTQKKQKECTDQRQAVESSQAHRELIYHLAETFLALSMSDPLFFPISEDPKLIPC